MQTIRLATAAADIETGDNAVLLQHIRELSRQLARSAVPKLLHWQDLFSQVAAVYAERVEVLHGPAAPSAFDSAHLQAHVVGDVAGAALLHQSHTSPSPSSLAACGAASTASVSCGSASLLGKRRADTAVSFAHPDMMETGTASATASTSALLELEKLQAEQRSVHLQLLDMAALLGEIHTLLTGKCKTLLQDEAI